MNKAGLHPGVAAWLEDHAYDVDDIVLGDRGLHGSGLRSLWELLDAVEPNWRQMFEDRG